VVQLWDLAQRKEVRCIDTPPGLRGSAEYALLAPDWKTLYVPVLKRSVKAFERDGKKMHRIEYAGEIRVWDLASGKEKAPLRNAEGTGPLTASLGPGGRLLVCVERASYETSDRPKDVTVVWDLAAGKKWRLSDGFVSPSFAPDGKTAVVRTYLENDAKALQLLDLATGKELARLAPPEKDRNFSVGPVSPDGAVVAVLLGGQKGAALEAWFLDARTLEVRGKVTGKGDPDWDGWGKGQFTPDGSRFVALGRVGDALVWDVAGRKLERTLPLDGERSAWRLALSPDGKTLAVGWAPKRDQGLEHARDPDPRDLPQPRVSLIDLAGKVAPRVLIAPHGYVGGLAFSPDGKTLAFGGAGAVHLFDLGK
jgi:WD40 repeat protein